MNNIESIMNMASNPKNWKKTHKKSYEVYVCRPLPGAQCMNRLEGSHYVTDQNKQFIISGTVGETWVIDVNKLAKTYTFADGTPITPDTLRKKCNEDGQMDWQKMKTRPDANTNWAMLIPKSVQNFPVQTSWGDTLLANRPGVGHGLGDFLVCADNGNGQPNLNDVWVVNGEVFPTTYDLHSFPNMFPQSVTAANTPTPQHRFMKKNPVKTRIDELALTIAKGLNSKGHRIGKLTNDSIETKSFTVDNGAYGILIQLDDAGAYLGIMSNSTGSWEEAAGWFLDDNDMSYNIERIHSIISGKRSKSDIYNRATKALNDDSGAVFVYGEEPLSDEEVKTKKAAERVFKAVKSMESKLRFSKVELLEGEGGRGTYRITIDRNGVNGFGVIDFDNPTKAYGCFLEEYSNETAGSYVDTTNPDSVKNILKLIYLEMNKY